MEFDERLFRNLIEVFMEMEENVNEVYIREVNYPVDAQVNACRW